MFEVLQSDGLARLGRLHTRHGVVITPTLMPVIHPVEISIPCSELREKFGVELLMTNAYLTRRHYGNRTREVGIHGILKYDGPIMTDSGAYQLLRHGVVEVGPEEIVKYQEEIAPDIATILDVPTGVSATRERAEETVMMTLERARQAQELRTRDDILWCGPVQGGLYEDLVAFSSREIGKLNFHVHAIGSPVELLEDYRYREVVRLTMTAKQNLPLSRPTHLFGVGHPMFLSLGVAMGCDLFDSAAYALYAKDGRYMTVSGTYKLDELAWFPCDCPMCVSTSPKDVREFSHREQVDFLARHNLYVTFAEIRTVRQAILEGSLFELLAQRCRAHPRLLEAYLEFLRLGDFIERHDRLSKPTAFFYQGPESNSRPEVIRHRRRMGYYFPPPLKTLVLFVAFGDEPRPEIGVADAHFVKVVPPFGPVPEELEEVYPLWQHEIPRELDKEGVEATVRAVAEYLERYGSSYDRIILVGSDEWVGYLKSACGRISDRVESVIRSS